MHYRNYPEFHFNRNFIFLTEISGTVNGGMFREKIGRKLIGIDYSEMEKDRRLKLKNPSHC